MYGPGPGSGPGPGQDQAPDPGLGTGPDPFGLLLSVWPLGHYFMGQCTGGQGRVSFRLSNVHGSVSIQYTHKIYILQSVHLYAVLEAGDPRNRTAIGGNFSAL